MIRQPLQDADAAFAHPVPAGSRRIAWDAVSFCVPSNWELAVYRFMRRGASRIELEDEYSTRVEAEWIHGGKRFNLSRIMKRYEDASKPLTLKSEARHDVTGLPAGWQATHFVFKETGAHAEAPDLEVMRHDLVTAFYLCPRSSIFCFFLLHVLPDDTEDPAATMRQLAQTFQHHRDAALTPWQLFDIAFQVPREFALARAHFDIGAKRMDFEWRRRQFHLWFFSCADMLFKDGATPAEWAVGYLNGFSGIHGPVFRTAGDGGMTWRRRRPYVLGHRSEIARWCYRYAVGCRRLEPENQLVVWVFHYRHARDLEKLAPFSRRFGEAAVLHS